MFLAGKAEETPRVLQDVAIVSYEIIHKKDVPPAQRKVSICFQSQTPSLSLFPLFFYFQWFLFLLHISVIPLLQEVCEQQKKCVLSAEELVLSTLNFDLSVGHPYEPLIDAIKKYKVEEVKSQFPQVAWSFVNDW